MGFANDFYSDWLLNASRRGRDRGVFGIKANNSYPNGAGQEAPIALAERGYMYSASLRSSAA